MRPRFLRAVSIQNSEEEQRGCFLSSSSSSLMGLAGVGFKASTPTSKQAVHTAIQWGLTITGPQTDLNRSMRRPQNEDLFWLDLMDSRGGRLSPPSGVVPLHLWVWGGVPAASKRGGKGGQRGGWHLVAIPAIGIIQGFVLWSPPRLGQGTGGHLPHLSIGVVT